MDEIFAEKESVPGAWDQYFLQLRRSSIVNNNGHCFSVQDAVDNRHLNRYADVLPFDHTRVRLQPGGEYINASHIHHATTGQRYIMAQGPLDSTMETFWQMVWENNVSTVLMLCRCIENRKPKCAQYWPLYQQFDKGSIQYSAFEVSLQAEADVTHEGFNVSRLVLSHQGKTRHITHLHYYAWPDFGIPESPDSFLKFLVFARESVSSGRVRNRSLAGCSGDAEEAPPVIHCSAGIGRSGVYVVVDVIIRLLETDPERLVDFKDLILDVRSQRSGIIQSPDQLRFTFKAVMRAKELLLQGEWPGRFISPASDDVDLEEDFPPPPPPVRINSLDDSRATSERQKVEERQKKNEATRQKLAEVKEGMKRSEQPFWQKYSMRLMFGGGVVFAFIYYYYWIRPPPALQG